MNKAVNNPFEEVKGKLKVILPGYGEKRDKRINIVLNEDNRKKAMYKCAWAGCTLNEAVNQLLYIWSKGEKVNDGVEAENHGTNENIGSFDKIAGNVEKHERTYLALEKTIHKKATAKCKRIGCTLNEAVNQVLHLWSQDVKEADIAVADNKQNNS